MKKAMEIQDELIQMPEWQMMNKIESLQLSFRIFSINAKQLINHISITEDPNEMHLSALENRHHLHEYQYELSRLLHNFTSSAFSLVDHTRRFYNKFYREKKIFPDYQNQIETVMSKNKYTQFFQGLRNFIIHKKIPNIGNNWAWNRDSGFQNSVFLNSAELLDFDDWKPEALTWIRGAEEGQIDLGNITRIYTDCITEFNGWFFHRLEEIHQDDITKIEKKKSEWRVEFGKHLPGLIDIEIRTYSKVHSKPETLFVQKIDASRYQEILNSTSNPITRATMLIQEVEQICTLKGETKQGVYSLFYSFYNIPQPESS
jgi:hypothetical protein